MVTFLQGLAVFLQVVIGVVILWYLAFLFETQQSSKKDRVLYHGSNIKEQGKVVKKVLEKYVGEEQEIAKYTLYEPGAGMGIVAYYLAAAYKWKQVVAIEIGPAILVAGKIRFMLARTKTAVTWVYADLFKVDYAPPGVVYCYLFPQLITKLYTEKKLDNCLVLSLTFAIEGLEPTETIELTSWQKRMYVYDLRKVPAKSGKVGK